MLLIPNCGESGKLSPLALKALPPRQRGITRLRRLRRFCPEKRARRGSRRMILPCPGIPPRPQSPSVSAPPYRDNNRSSLVRPFLGLKLEIYPAIRFIILDIIFLTSPETISTPQPLLFPRPLDKLEAGYTLEPRIILYLGSPDHLTSELLADDQGFRPPFSMHRFLR